MGEMWSELRRRNVFRVAVAYAVTGWVLLQVSSLIAPALGLPGWAFSFVLFVLIIGFPLALLFAWAFELTPEGLKRTGDVDPQASVTAQTGRKFDFVIIGVLSVALLFFVGDRVLTSSDGDPDASGAVVRSSIAVLPFVNMSSDPEQEYFSDGISEELLNLLARTQGLRVAARTSSFAFKGQSPDIRDVGKKLNVATVLEGSVRQSGTRLRITAQLIDVASGYHLWSDTYERELTDIFAIQDEISKSIVDALHVHLGVEAPTMPKARETDAEAYRLYLLGRHNFEQRTQEKLYKAIDFFDRAISIDPGYAPAYSGKADAYMLLDGYGDLSTAESIAFAEPLIERALELDPDLAEAHASKGLLLVDSGQYQTSLQAFDRAIELNPNLARAWHWKSESLLSSGDIRGGLTTRQRAHELDPLSPPILTVLIGLRMSFGQLPEAEELLERLRSISPGHDYIAGTMTWLQRTQGNLAASYSYFNKEFDADPSETNGSQLGFAQLSLNAFDSDDARFSSVTRVSAISFTDPARAWQEYQTLPAATKEDLDLTSYIVRAAAREGRYEIVIELLENWPGIDGTASTPLLDGHFPRAILAPLVALAKQKTGDEAGAEVLVAEVEAWIQTQREQGTTWTLSELEAMVHALKGQDDAVVTALEQAQADGYLTWYRLNYPFYDAVRDREDFQAIVRSVDAKVNEERAKLGWEPVE